MCEAPRNSIPPIVLDAIVEGGQSGAWRGQAGWGRGAATEIKCLLCSMVSCRELLVPGQSELPGSSLGENDNTEQRGEGKQSQKHLFRTLGLLCTDEERRLWAAIDQITLIKHLVPHYGLTSDLWSYISLAESLQTDPLFINSWCSGIHHHKQWLKSAAAFSQTHQNLAVHHQYNLTKYFLK